MYFLQVKFSGTYTIIHFFISFFQSQEQCMIDGLKTEIFFSFIYQASLLNAYCKFQGYRYFQTLKNYKKKTLLVAIAIADTKLDSW